MKDNNCVDCGKIICVESTRCRSCANKHKSKGKKINTCVDCGKIIRQQSTRCETCAGIKHRVKKNHCIECDKVIQPKAKRCSKCDLTKRNKENIRNGSKNGNWKGGLSFGKYCHKFNNQRKEKIRKEYGRKCVICGKNEEDNGKKLTVHHVDYNKEQGCKDHEWKLVPLCKSCHAKTNGNRTYWETKLITEVLNMQTPQQTLQAYK